MTDPSVASWRLSMEPYIYGRLVRVENERDELRKDLAVALEQWQLDIAALIEARQENERQAIRIKELENQLRQEGGSTRAY
jgi:hypothetical protein